MAITEKERDADYKALVKEIRVLSITLYCIIKDSTFQWRSKGTASVSIRGGVLHFEFNTQLWDMLSTTERMFVLLHEIYHVFLDHFGRLPPVTPVVSRAADLANNSALLKHFNFKRKKMKVLGPMLCWPDTIIPGLPLADDLSAEEYLWILEKNEDKLPKGEPGNTGVAGEEGSIDDHSKMDPKDLDKFLKGKMGEMKDDLMEEGLTEQKAQKELEKFIQDIPDADARESLGKMAGTGVGNLESVDDIIKKRKMTWTQYARYLKRSVLGLKENTVWIPDRRTHSLAQQGLFVPSYKERDGRRGRVCVVLFLDTSWSCDHLRPYFFGFAKALDPEIFEVITFGFNSKTYPINLANPQYIGGGTSFAFQSTFDKVTNPSKYGFVFTDGDVMGMSDITEPERWHWFLSANNTRAIPAGCAINMLKNFD